MRRREQQHLIDTRYEGRGLEVYTVDGEKLTGLVDEVATFEIGMVVEGRPVVVNRKAILYAVTGLSDIHGWHPEECCESDYVLDEDFIGADVVVKLVNGSEISGRLMKLSRYEIGVVQGNRAYIIPRRSISFVKIMSR
ncbi:MAG: hypothetical protein DRO39_05720 [Thermoprotei archaeon]|nr:MAG: hypothetical protein DRO39_05720 [Thermoprotei archaeon]